MTISQDSTAPLVVVCGATGIQGGSVIRGLADSDRAYRFRGLTRDASKPAAVEWAKQGVEMVSVSLSVGNEENIKKAFEGGDIIFIMTNFWEHLDMQREIAEGKALVDAAKAVNPTLVIWSGLDSVIEMSKGKYTLVDHFEGKSQITAYAKASGIPLAIVQAGLYASNMLALTKPQKQADGSFVVALTIGEDALVPIIDADADYGLFVREAIESPAFGAGSEVLSAGELISLKDMIRQLAEITGKNVNFYSCSDEEWKANFPGPERIALEGLESYRASGEFGYYGSKDIGPSMKHLARKPRTWAEYVKATNWDAVFA